MLRNWAHPGQLPLQLGVYASVSLWLLGHKRTRWDRIRCTFVDGVRFDGLANGVLQEVKGSGDAKFVRNGQFQAWFRGADDLASQARRQVAEARWHSDHLVGSGGRRGYRDQQPVHEPGNHRNQRRPRPVRYDRIDGPLLPRRLLGKADESRRSTAGSGSPPALPRSARSTKLLALGSGVPRLRQQQERRSTSMRGHLADSSRGAVSIVVTSTARLLRNSGSLSAFGTGRGRLLA